MQHQYTAIVGKVIHSLGSSDMQVFEKGIICFENQNSGKILLIEDLSSDNLKLENRTLSMIRETAGNVSMASIASDCTSVEDDTSLPSSFQSASSFLMSRSSSNALFSLGRDELDVRFSAFALLKARIGVTQSDVNLIMLQEKSFLIPGFIDTHFHAPQYAFTGTGYDLPLLGWLNKYTFPCESKFKDTEFAEKVYSRVVRRLLENGTTTCSYYATIHLESTKVLAEQVKLQGQRALVGKVNMDQNSPDYYCETTQQSLDDTRQFCQYVAEEIDSPRVQAVITPRFAPTCSRELMRGLGELMKEFDVPMQTHISENPDEIEWVKSLFPECSSYTDVYEQMGLLDGANAVLAHGIHLSPEEISIIKRCGAGICHCPQSNMCLMSGFLETGKLIEDEVKIGLGTDASGGYAYSMLDAMRSAIATSKVVRVNKRSEGLDVPPLTLANALWLATLGGAHVLSMQDRTGNFAPGKAFDGLIVSLDAADCLESGEFGHGVDVFDEIDGSGSAEALLEKFLYLGDSRNIKSVFVDSKCVLSK